MPLRERLLSAAHLPVALYVATAAVLALFAGNDTSVAREYPHWLTIAWSLAGIVGGVVVALGTSLERSRLESTGHAFCVAAMAVFLLAEGLVGPHLPGVMTLTLVSLIRMRVLRRAREAHEEATRLVEGA